jgi:hypothetical protein
MAECEFKQAARARALSTCVLVMGFVTACQCETIAPPVSTVQPVFDVVAREGETAQPLCDVVLPESTPWRQVWRSRNSGDTEGGVNAMLRDGDWLWIATPFDLVRLDLDTLDCAHFGSAFIDGSSEAPIYTRALLLDPEGHLWAASHGALHRFDGEGWQSISLGDQTVSGLAFDAEGNLWTNIAHQRGGMDLRRYRGHEPPKEGGWAGEAIVRFPPSNQIDCNEWFASDTAFLHPFDFRSPEECRLLTDWYERLISLTPPEGIVPWGEYPLIAAESDERLWMLVRQLPDEHNPDDVLLSFDGQSWQVLSWPYGPTDLLVADDARGGVWIGTAEGLVFSDGQSFQQHPLSPADAIPVGPRLSDLVADADGRLWAATSEQGLLLYDEASGYWRSTEIAEPVLISADDGGGLWAASRFHSGFVSHFDGETWTHYPLPADWPCSSDHILADVGGGVWLISTNCALRGFNDEVEVWDEYDTGMPGEQLARGPRGEVYAVGWYGALKRLDGTTWTTLLPPSSDGRLPGYPRVVKDIVVSSKDDVWVAFDDVASLFVYRGSGWEKVPAPTEGKITALLIDSQGNLWAGHEFGLLRYDGQSWEDIVSETRLTTVVGLAEDQGGLIWVARSDGLYVYDPAGE